MAEAYQDLPLGVVVIGPKGEYSASTTYSLLDQVCMPDGKSYIYVNETPTKGNTPPNAAYWMLFSNVGDLTTLKQQLQAAVTQANGLSTTLQHTIDERLAALTQAGGAELAEVVDARLGATSLRERMTAVRAMWYHSFFEADGKIYTVKFSNATNAAVGTRADDAVDMTANASTDTVRGANDFDSVPIFRSFRANGYVDAAGEFVVQAIEGEPAFKLDGSNGDVWVLFKPCWFKVSLSDTEDVYSVSDSPHGAGWFPSPGLVRPDGTLRPFLPIAAYRAATVSGVPVSASGKLADYNVSHNSQLTNMRKKGEQYCGMTSKDMFHLTTLMEIEYATRNEKSVVYGCLNYNYQYTPATVENGVERFVLTSAQAANIVIGSCVSIGNPTAMSGASPNIDRGQAGMHAKANRVLVTRKEVLDGGNVAIYVDNGGKTFDTAAGTIGATAAPTYLTTMPWHTGSTDSVLGPTGSPGDLHNGRYDMRYRYVETVWGNQYLVLSDEVRKGDKLYVCDDCTKSSTALTSDYKELSYSLQFTKTNQWCYPSRLGFDPEHPSVMEPTACDATSTTGYCCGYYISPDTSALYAAWASCDLIDANRGGPRARSLVYAVTAPSWGSASRLSATGRCGHAMPAA